MEEKANDGRSAPKWIAVGPRPKTGNAKEFLKKHPIKARLNSWTSAFIYFLPMLMHFAGAAGTGIGMFWLLGGHAFPLVVRVLVSIFAGALWLYYCEFAVLLGVEIRDWLATVLYRRGNNG